MDKHVSLIVIISAAFVSLEACGHTSHSVHPSPSVPVDISAPIAPSVSMRPSSADPFLRPVFHHCYDGDTCTVTLPSLPDVFGDRISIRLVGIDTPEIKGHCEREKRLAAQARDLLNHELMQAKTIEIRHTARDKYFRVLAEIFADGRDMSDIMIQRGFAVRITGGRRVRTGVLRRHDCMGKKCLISLSCHRSCSCCTDRGLTPFWRYRSIRLSS
jgi:micrococcal nuclease